MARIIDSPELFGVGMGISTNGDLTCDVCKSKYNIGNDKTQCYGGDSVLYTEFAGLVVCYDCFEKIENEILRRMPDILTWYRKTIKDRQAKIDKEKEAFDSLWI